METEYGGQYIHIYLCPNHPNERWDVQIAGEKPLCLPCEIKLLRSEVKRMDGVIYAIRRHSDSLLERMTENRMAVPIQSTIQGMVHDKTVDFDNAIQIDVFRIARAVLKYLEGEK